MGFQKVLLIDDDEDDQEIFVTAAAAASREAVCTTCVDAGVALEKLVRKEITPDVIFLDLNMPVMNGQQFLQAVKNDADLKSIPVIIFSTSSHPQAIRMAKNLGAHAFITKPGLFNDLVGILRPFLT